MSIFELFINLCTCISLRCKTDVLNPSLPRLQSAANVVQRISLAQSDTTDKFPTELQIELAMARHTGAWSEPLLGGYLFNGEDSWLASYWFGWHWLVAMQDMAGAKIYTRDTFN